MRAGARLTAVLAVLAVAGPALAQTRGDQVQTKPTTTTTAPRATSTQPTRTAPATMPVDPGGLTGLPPGSSTGTSPTYGPAGPGGVRTVRPRRSAEPPPDVAPTEDIPYVDPPAAPGYESAADAGPMKTAGRKPPPPTAAHTVTPPAPPPPSATPPAPGASRGAVVAMPPPLKPGAVTVSSPPLVPGLPGNALWIALAGLAAMLAAAGLGLRHILTAPHLTFRVTVDHGVQSAPRFKGAS